jgi:FkbM family methyltransferase
MMILYKWLSWVPFTKPIPLRNFPQRLCRKWTFIGRNILMYFGPKYGFFGAKFVGLGPMGNSLLRLNQDYALGPKGFMVQLPRDQVIFENVRKHGSWELKESQFLCVHLKNACRLDDSKVALVDIGANTGLVALQAMNLSKTKNAVFLFEPIPRHTEAIKHNLKYLPNVHINEFALSDKKGRSIIFTQASNHGNSSMFKSVVKSEGKILTEIVLEETTEYFNSILKEFNKFVLKCDTQGMDALILSRIPNNVWKKTECAIIEVWALAEIKEEDVTKFLDMCKEFSLVSWDPDFIHQIELADVKEFWLSKSKNSKNLFLSKGNSSRDL